MTPAEQLAKTKPRREYKEKRRPWNCELAMQRKRLRLTMREVAEACGIAPTALYAIEHGTDTKLTTARKLATFFGVTVEALWPSRRDE